VEKVVGVGGGVGDAEKDGEGGRAGGAYGGMHRGLCRTLRKREIMCRVLHRRFGSARVRGWGLGHVEKFEAVENCSKYWVWLSWFELSL
jgi:hypothetical protein